MYRRIIVSLLFATALLHSAVMSFADESVSSAGKQEEELLKRSHELYQQVLSPFCPGRSLNDCPSSKAQELKDELRSRLQAGESQKEILDDVFAKFGDQYRAVPVFAGFGIFVWLVPIGFVVLGFAAAAAVAFGRRGRAPTLESNRTPQLSESVAKKLAEELKNLQ
jgi:cytochrome c-type biogenesis protein CcmH